MVLLAPVTQGREISTIFVDYYLVDTASYCLLPDTL